MTAPNVTATEKFVITRTFDAPLQQVFAAWTTREALGRWWGPKGWNPGVLGLDFRPGGFFHYELIDSTGNTLWGRMNFLRIVPEQEIVYVDSFADESGKIIQSPFSADFPQEILHTCQFTGENGKTTITITGEPINASEAERLFFQSVVGSMNDGYAGTLDKLDDYLEQTIG